MAEAEAAIERLAAAPAGYVTVRADQRSATDVEPVGRTELLGVSHEVEVMSVDSIGIPSCLSVWTAIRVLRRQRRD